MSISPCRRSTRRFRRRGQEQYLYDDKALEQYRKRHIPGSFTLQRYKGLGEMDAEQLWETTLNPETPDVEAGGDRGCPHGLRGDGDADGNAKFRRDRHLSMSTLTMQSWISDDKGEER